MGVRERDRQTLKLGKGGRNCRQEYFKMDCSQHWIFFKSLKNLYFLTYPSPINSMSDLFFFKKECQTDPQIWCLSKWCEQIRRVLAITIFLHHRKAVLSNDQQNEVCVCMYIYNIYIITHTHTFHIYACACMSERGRKFLLLFSQLYIYKNIKSTTSTFITF